MFLKINYSIQNMECTQYSEVRIAKKTRIGILPSIARFSAFVRRAEAIFENAERRTDLEKASVLKLQIKMSLSYSGTSTCVVQFVTESRRRQPTPTANHRRLLSNSKIIMNFIVSLVTIRIGMKTKKLFFSDTFRAENFMSWPATKGCKSIERGTHWRLCQGIHGTTAQRNSGDENKPDLFLTFVLDVLW